jgi:hypothetical protein
MNSSDFVKDGWQAGLWRITTCTASFTGGTAGSVSDGVVTIGANNTAVTVSNAFSAKYDNYRIIITGGVGSQTNLFRLTLGSTVTGYKNSINYGLYGANTTAAIAGSTARIDYAGTFDVNRIFMDLNIYNPFAAKYTLFHGPFINIDAQGTVGGILENTTSYTAFTLTAAGGNFSSGILRVYGYNN